MAAVEPLDRSDLEELEPPLGVVDDLGDVAISGGRRHE